MRTEDLYKISHNYGVLIAAFTFIMVIMVAVVGVVLNMQISLATAVNDLQKCEQAKHKECHIERDGTNYNVYWREK